MIALTYWTGVKATVGRLYRLDEGALFDALATPRPAPSKLELPGFAPVEFRDNRRALGNVLAVFGCGVDIDHGDASLADLTRAFGAYLGFIYSTPSSRPDDRRWRVVLPFAEPVANVPDARRAIRAAQRLAPVPVDTGTCDPSRLWFFPWSEASHWECARLDGEPLDARGIAAREREREERERQAKRALRFEPLPAVDGGYAARALACACRAIANASEGDRHRTLAREAFSVGTLVGAGLLTYGQAWAALDGASRGVFPANREDERQRTIRQCLDDGAKQPRACNQGVWS